MTPTSPSPERPLPGRTPALLTFLGSPRLWLIASLLVGLSVRGVQYARCHSYWYDEAYLLLNVFQRPCHSLLGPIDYNVVIPPCFLWLLRGTYLVAGGGEQAMRLAALLAGLAALGLMVPLARLWVGRSGWVWAVCWCSLSYHALTHGCEVRPYSVDLLVTEAILLSAGHALRAGASPRARNRGLAALGGLALIGPWLSFPSAFVLGAASLALLLHYRRGGRRSDLAAWCALNALVGITCLALWYFSARHLYYPGMIEHWGHLGWGGFPDWAAPLSVVRWGLATPFRVADYAATGLGVPLVALSVVGLVSLRRHSGWPAVALLAGPVALATAAAYLGRYPMADRTQFFAAPCVWLPAAVGLEVLRRRLSGRRLLAGVALPALLLLPGAARMGKRLVLPLPYTEYREAFAFLRERQRPGDVVWVSHAEVYLLYHGEGAAVLDMGKIDRLDRLGRDHRVWLVSSYAPQQGGGVCCPEAPNRLLRAGRVATLRRGFTGVEVALYESADAPAGTDTASTPRAVARALAEGG